MKRLILFVLNGIMFFYALFWTVYYVIVPTLTVDLPLYAFNFWIPGLIQNLIIAPIFAIIGIVELFLYVGKDDSEYYSILLSTALRLLGALMIVSFIILVVSVAGTTLTLKGTIFGMDLSTFLVKIGYRTYHGIAFGSFCASFATRFIHHGKKLAKKKENKNL